MVFVVTDKRQKGRTNRSVTVRTTVEIVSAVIFAAIVTSRAADVRSTVGSVFRIVARSFERVKVQAALIVRSNCVFAAEIQVAAILDGIMNVFSM